MAIRYQTTANHDKTQAVCTCIRSVCPDTLLFAKFICPGYIGLYHGSLCLAAGGGRLLYFSFTRTPPRHGEKVNDRYRITYGFAWLTIFHEWWSHECKLFPYRLTSDKTIVIHANPYIILFLTRYFMSWTHNWAKTLIDRPFRHGRQGRSFLTEHCDVTTVDLYARYSHCDVKLVDCSCTRNLTQRRSSLMNNNREYRFPATRYSRLSM